MKRRPILDLDVPKFRTSNVDDKAKYVETFLDSQPCANFTKLLVK